MTELQKIEFELLKYFVEICNRYDLTYYLVCGSALGAAKYQGFIPWDDDIDVALPRKDYEIFLEKAQDLLPEHVFLQNYRTEKYYYALGSKLRDSSTTYIEKGIGHLPMNHGVFIDVFPLDGYPEDEKEIRLFERKKMHYYRRRYVRLRPVIHRDIGLTFCSVLHRLFGMYSDTEKYVRENELLNRKYPVEESKFWCNYANSRSKVEYAPSWQYGTGTMMKFEGLDVRIPEKYDEYLTQKYGDWRADLPKEKQVGHHYYEVCDLNTPYTDYLEKLSDGLVRIKKSNQGT